MATACQLPERQRPAGLSAVMAAINGTDNPLCFVEGQGRTPETDAQSKLYAGQTRGFWVRSSFARKLERERDDLRQVLSRLREIAQEVRGVA